MKLASPLMFLYLMTSYPLKKIIAHYVPYCSIQVSKKIELAKMSIDR